MRVLISAMYANPDASFTTGMAFVALLSRQFRAPAIATARWVCRTLTRLCLQLRQPARVFLCFFLRGLFKTNVSGISGDLGEMAGFDRRGPDILHDDDEECLKSSRQEKSNDRVWSATETEGNW